MRRGASTTIRRTAATLCGGKRVRAAGALALAGLSVLCTVKPVHAELESVYVIPGQVCAINFPNLCTARTAVHVLLPAGYAACTAELNLTELGLGATDCGSPDLQDAYLQVTLSWDPGSCATLQSRGPAVRGDSPLWSIGAQSDTSASPTCASIDYAISQSFAVPGCPGTTFQITADIRGNADGTYTSNYNVIAAGPCAGAYEVIAVEGPFAKLNLQ